MRFVERVLLLEERSGAPAGLIWEINDSERFVSPHDPRSAVMRGMEASLRLGKDRSNWSWSKVSRSSDQIRRER